MLAKSAKEKGRRYEKRIVELIKESGLDPRAGREIGSGSGLAKGDIRSTIPFLIEAKNQKVVHILDWIDQSKGQTQKGWVFKDKWALVFRDPRFPENQDYNYVVIDFNEFLNLLKHAEEPKLKEPDRQFKYNLENLKRAIGLVTKDLN